MKPTEQQLEVMRRSFAAAAEAVADPDDRAVTADEMWDVITGALVGGEARDVVRRVAGSAQAQVDWRITVEMVREAGLEVVVADASEADRKPALRDELAARRSQKAYWAGWVGAAVAAAAIAFFVLRPTRDEPNVPPTIRDVPRTRITSTVPAGPISSQRDLVLQWSGGPSQARYDVRVTAENLRVIDAAFNITTPRYTLPAATLRAHEGTTIYWRVVATSRAGERIESPSFSLRIGR